MKTALIEIAKYIIGEEINANLDGIHPVYNSETMTPLFQVFFTFLLMCSSQQNYALNMARLDMQNVFAIFPFKGTSPQPF